MNPTHCASKILVLASIIGWCAGMIPAAEKSGKHLMVAWNRTYALGRVKEIFADEPPAVFTPYRAEG